MTFLVKMLGSGQDTTSYTVLCALLMMSTLSFRLALPGKWPVFCIGSNITSLCEVVHFATCLTRRVESSRFPANFVIVGIRVVCVAVDISGIISVAFNLMFVRHSLHMTFIWLCHTVKLYIPFEVCHNLFIHAVLQVGLIYGLLQVWRHFGIYELFNDGMGSYSECVFGQFL